MLIDSLLNRGSMPVLERVMSFTEARQQVLANNVSNLDTVGYKMQDLPEAEFSAALREAVDRRDSAGTSAELMLRNTRHLQWDQNGRLHAEPAEIEDSNILFHDEFSNLDDEGEDSGEATINAMTEEINLLDSTRMKTDSTMNETEKDLNFNLLKESKAFKHKKKQPKRGKKDEDVSYVMNKTSPLKRADRSQSNLFQTPHRIS